MATGLAGLAGRRPSLTGGSLPLLGFNGPPLHLLTARRPSLQGGHQPPLSGRGSVTSRGPATSRGPGTGRRLSITSLLNHGSKVLPADDDGLTAGAALMQLEMGKDDVGGVPAGGGQVSATSAMALYRRAVYSDGQVCMQSSQ